MSTAQRVGEPVERPFAAAVSRALNTTSTGPNGGYLLSTELARFVWDKAREYDGPLARCLFLTTSRNQFDLPVFSETSRAAGSRWGGIRAYWEGDDDADLTPYLSDPSVALAAFNPERVIAYTQVSNDLLADSDLAESALSYAASSDIRYAVQDAMINGSGIKRPLGVINAPSTITATRAGANAIAANDVTNMWSRLYGPCRRNAIWLANDDSMVKIDQAAETGGWLSNVYLPQGMYGNPFPLLKGRPLIPCEQCPPLGQPGDLILGDWSQYALASRSLDGSPEIGMATGSLASVIEARSSVHKYFSTDQAAILWKLRIDGKPLWLKPMTIADGAQACGPFCILSVGS